MNGNNDLDNMYVTLRYFEEKKVLNNKYLNSQ